MNIKIITLYNFLNSFQGVVNRGEGTADQET